MMLVSRPPSVDQRGETNMPMGTADVDAVFEVKETEGESNHERGNSVGSVESQPGAAKQRPPQADAGAGKPKCARCREPIFGRASTISERQFHAKCMKCSFGACQRPIPPGEPVYLYYDRGNGKKKDRAWLPYCKDHCLYTPPYMGHCSAALCRDNLLLGKPITTVNGKKFHQACVFCSVCGCTFPNNRGVYLKKAKFYCKADYEQTIMPKCTVCKGVIRGGENIMIVNDQKMHAACLQLGEDDPEPDEPEPIDVSQQPDTELILLPSLPDSVRNSFDTAPEEKSQPPPRRPRGHRQMRSIIQVRESPSDSGWLGLVPDEDANLTDTQRRRRHDRTLTMSSAAPTEQDTLESLAMTLESVSELELEEKDSTPEQKLFPNRLSRDRARTTAVTTLPNKVIPPPPRRAPPPRPKAMRNREGSNDSLRRSNRSCSQPDLTNAMKAVAASRLRKQRQGEVQQQQVQKKRGSVLDLVSRFER